MSEKDVQKLKPGDVVVCTDEAKQKLDFPPEEMEGERVVIRFIQTAEKLDYGDSVVLYPPHRSTSPVAVALLDTGGMLGAGWLRRVRSMTPQEYGRFVLVNRILTRRRAEKLQPGDELEFTPRALRELRGFGEVRPGVVRVAEVLKMDNDDVALRIDTGEGSFSICHFRFPAKLEKTAAK